jgi:histidine kinase
MTNATLTQAAPAQQTAMGARFWMTRVWYGLLLGAMIATLEFAYYFPIASWGGGLGFDSFVALLLVYCIECLVLVLAVATAEIWASPRELRVRELAFAGVLGALAGALISQIFAAVVVRGQLELRLFVDQMGQPVDWVGQLLYHSWLMLFFGGLAAAVYSSQRRRASMVATLRAAEVGRETSQQRLAEVTLASLRARIDPEFLFQTLAKLERLYEADPPEADRLLEELIVFLRAALADLQATGASVTPDRTQARDEAFQAR